MKTSIKSELASHVLDRIHDGVIDDGNKDEWHFYCFNQDYYIIGYYVAEQWLKNHNLSVFEAIQTCQQYEIDNFGESRIYDNAESTVNMLVYIYGEDLLYSEDFNNIKELKEYMEDLI